MKYTVNKKQKALIMWLTDGKKTNAVCREIGCNECSLYRWRKRWDGKKESLENRYCPPHTPDKKIHTKEEMAEILQMHEKYPNAGYMELHGRLRAECAYSRSYWGFRHYVVTNHLFNEAVEEHIKRELQPYDTPTMIGEKAQIDIKYVPVESLIGEALKRYRATGEKLYQFTSIDECSREVFEYAYQDMGVNSAVNFLKRSFIYYGYIPRRIQTDNGLMFRLPYHAKKDTAHDFEDTLKLYRVAHQLIRAYTPQHISCVVFTLMVDYIKSRQDLSKSHSDVRKHLQTS
jgi:transposase-like protein